MSIKWIEISAVNTSISNKKLKQKRRETGNIPVSMGVYQLMHSSYEGCLYSKDKKDR